MEQAPAPFADPVEGMDAERRMTKIWTLVVELSPHKITVNAIAPGWVETDMAALGMTQGAKHAKVSFDEFKDRQISAVPIKRIIDPAEVSGLVKFLCSPDAAAITGQTYNICGGQVMS